MKKHNLKKRLFFFLTCGALLFGGSGNSIIKAEEYWPEGMDIDTPSAVVMEVETGTILYEKNMDDVHYPASITKVLTTLLAIENAKLNEIVTFSNEAVAQSAGGSSSISRDYGEQMTMEQCLLGVMLESANECAYAVAEHVGESLGGDYQTFVDLMNERAKGLGCENTHFTNSNGLPDEEHVTTAHDMALISAEAYKNPTFRKIVGTETYMIPATNKHDELTPLNNHHNMLHYHNTDKYIYPYCTGGKTGYTVAAGSTLVTYAEKDGMTLVCVVMNTVSPKHWTDTRALFDYCFDNFQVFNIIENEDSIEDSSTKDLGILNDASSFVTLDKSAYIILPKTAEFSDAKFSLDTGFGQDKTVAALKYTYAGRDVGSVEIVTTGAEVKVLEFPEVVEEENPGKVIFVKPIWILFVVIAIAFVIAIIFLIKKLFDNFYVIRHRIENRRERRERFRRVKREKGHSRRKRDRMFK